MSILWKRHRGFYQQIPPKALLHDPNNDDNSAWIRFFWGFLLHRDYLSLRDKELNWLCRLIKLFALLFLFTFCASIYLLFRTTF